MKDKSHSDQTIPREIDTWVNDATVPLASDNSVFSLHTLGHIGLADLCAIQGSIKKTGDKVERLSCRKICDYWTRLSAQYVKHC